MKKAIIIFIVVLSIPMTIFATSYQSLYSLDVPYRYQSLYLTGNFGGGEALNISINTTSAITFNADASINGNYSYVDHTDDIHFELSSAGTFLEFGSTGLKANAQGSANYKNYAFSIQSLPAYYIAAGNASVFVNIPFSTATSFFSVMANPIVGVGIGKLHNIEPIKNIINTMEYFKIRPTEEMIEDVARIEYLSPQHFNTYSHNNAELWTSYHRELVSAYGLEDKIVEFINHINSQEYLFETQRWATLFSRFRSVDLMYGWEAYAQLRPKFFFRTAGVTNTVIFSIEIALGGMWATLLADESIYVNVSGELVPIIDVTGTKIFNFVGNIDAYLRYFFANPRMWVDSYVSLDFNLNRIPTFILDLSGTFNYLIAPNFSAYGGVRVFNTFDSMSIVAGGNMRLF